MADEVKLPGVGQQNKKAVYFIGSAAGLYVAWRWYKARQASAAVAAANAAIPTPVDTANTAADQSGTGYTNPAPAPGAGSSASSGPGLATNADWTQKVETDLTGLGYDPQVVATALGLYLSSQPLTLDQQNIVRQAWAFEGKPPQNTTLPIIPVQSAPSGGGGTPPPSGGGGGGTPAPPPAPKFAYYTSDGTISLNTLALIHHVTPQSIIDATRPHQPSDVAAYLKMTGNTYTHVLPKNTKWIIPLP